MYVSGGSRQDYLGILRAQTNNNYTPPTFLTDNSGLSSASIKVSQSGVLYVVKPSSGVDIYVPQSNGSYSAPISFNTSNGLLSSTIYKIAVDSNNTLYVATASGVSILRLQANNTFTTSQLTTAQGLFSNTVLDIAVGYPNNTLYLATFTGLQIATPQGGNAYTVTRLTTANGLSSNNFINVGVDSLGTVYAVEQYAINILVPQGGNSYSISYLTTTINGLTFFTSSSNIVVSSKNILYFSSLSANGNFSILCSLARGSATASCIDASDSTLNDVTSINDIATSSDGLTIYVSTNNGVYAINTNSNGLFP